jgi:hypothetical protein
VLEPWDMSSAEGEEEEDLEVEISFDNINLAN